MASADKRHAKPLRTIVLIFLVGALALGAAYWWMTDSGAHGLAQSSSEAAAVPAVTTVPPKPVEAVQAPAVEAADIAAPVAPLDPQIASDAAAAGTTSRVRPPAASPAQ